VVSDQGDGGEGVPRLILFHKQKTSARTRFLLFADTVLAFGPLPVSASVATGTGAVRPHPAAYLRAAEQRLALPAGSLEAVGDFSVDVDTATGPVPVLLAGFTSIDPPFAAAEAIGARFAPITEARRLPDVELELLRQAYEVLIG
jgi:hypothetical protein